MVSPSNLRQPTQFLEKTAMAEPLVTFPLRTDLRTCQHGEQTSALLVLQTYHWRLREHRREADAREL